MSNDADRPVATEDWLTSFKDCVVCVDIGDQFQIFGTLSAFDLNAVSFQQADLHNVIEANSDRDQYASETAEMGVRVNRTSLTIPRNRIIAISKLTDIC